MTKPKPDVSATAVPWRGAPQLPASPISREEDLDHSGGTHSEYSQLTHGAGIGFGLCYPSALKPAQERVRKTAGAKERCVHGDLGLQDQHCPFAGDVDQEAAE